MGPNFADEIDCGNLFENIDDLIDFPSDNDCCNGFVGSGDYNDDFSSIWNEALPDTVNIFSGTSSNAASDLSADLSLPYGDIPQLEWFSTFKEESFSDGDGVNLDNDNLHLKEKSHNYQFHTSSPVSVLESSSSSSSSSCSGEKVIPRGLQRARSKRPRPATFNPRPAIDLTSLTSSFSGSPHALSIDFGIPTESENLSESREPLEKLSKPEAMMTMEEVMPKKKKKKVKVPAIPVGGASPMDNINQNTTAAQAVRKCLHCEITKTPQWRAGPMGPKTLCNACGVRYKSGRLFPEYRPAASPTFVPSLHSNSHKKVIEMRSKDLYKQQPAAAAAVESSNRGGLVMDTKPSSSSSATVEYM